jgi:hypothetical protein
MLFRLAGERLQVVTCGTNPARDPELDVDGANDEVEAKAQPSFVVSILQEI